MLEGLTCQDEDLVVKLRGNRDPGRMGPKAPLGEGGHGRETRGLER